jgi:hypothetical protein
MGPEGHSSIPGAQLTLFEGGHMFFLFRQRREVLRWVEDFLAEPGSSFTG